MGQKVLRCVPRPASQLRTGARETAQQRTPGQGAGAQQRRGGQTVKEKMLHDHDLARNIMYMGLRGLCIAGCRLVIAEQKRKLQLDDQVIRDGRHISGRPELGNGSLLVIVLVGETGGSRGLALESENVLQADAQVRNREAVLGLSDETLAALCLGIHIAELGAACELEENGLEYRVIGVLNVAAIQRQPQRGTQQLDARLDRLTPEIDEAGENQNDLAALHDVAAPLGKVDGQPPKLMASLVVAEQRAPNEGVQHITEGRGAGVAVAQ